MVRAGKTVRALTRVCALMQNLVPCPRILASAQAFAACFASLAHEVGPAVIPTNRTVADSETEMTKNKQHAFKAGVSLQRGAKGD